MPAIRRAIAWVAQAWLVAIAALAIAAIWALDAPHSSPAVDLVPMVAWSCAPYVALSLAMWCTRSAFGRWALALTTLCVSVPMLPALRNVLLETDHSWVLMIFLSFPPLQLAGAGAAVVGLLLRWWLARRRVRTGAAA